MLTTYNKNQFAVSADGTIVSFKAGTARLGNTLVHWDGTRVSYANSVSFSGDSSVYQNSLMYLQNSGGIADMTKAVSAEASSVLALENPVMPSVDASTYSMNFPLAMLTFYTPDGTTPQLVAYKAA